MNFLAHIYLARHSQQAMVGALLGDFNPGQAIHAMPPEMAREIQLHRLVDSYTDTHPQVLQCKALFPDGVRRFSGIVLDVYFDYLLSQHWHRYSAIARTQLIADFYQALTELQAYLPGSLQNLRSRMISQDWLGSYAEVAGLRLAVQRTSQRLSRHGERLQQALALAEQHHDQLETAFLEFFPELERYVSVQRQILLQAV